MGTSTLKSISVNANNKSFCDVNGVLFTKDKTKIVIYPQGKTDATFTIPNSVKTIGENAFINGQIQSITIPSSVTTLGDCCFARTNIGSITIPASVTQMGYGTFSGCANLTTAVVNASVTELPYITFSECPKLSTATLGNKIQNLDSRIFYKCTSLTKVTLPSNLKKIEYSFLGCTSLAQVTIPATVEWITAGSFEPNTQLDISKTKLQKLDNGTYAITYNVYVTGTFDYKKAYEVLDKVNEERKKKGLSSLTMDRDLLEAAMQRARETSIYFDHTRPSGLNYYTICSKMSGENITAGSSTAEGAMNEWMNSPKHKDNILTSSWKSIGIGCFYTNGQWYWTQCFSSDTAINVSMPANKTEKQAVKTLDDKISLQGTSLTNVNVKMQETTTIGKIYNINTGWPAARVILEPESFTWTSGSAKTATVTSKGAIKGIKTGNTTVKAAIGNKALTYNISVKLPFTDVGEGEWFYAAVNDTYCKGIIKGSGNKFEPNSKLTRGMIVTILYRMEGSNPVPNSNKFTDVKKSEYYYDAVKWAASKGIVNGYGQTGKFGPDDPVKRQDLAVILMHYTQYKGKKISATGNLSKFKDGNATADYAKEAMQWAVARGVITGSEATKKVSPNGTATRAEAASMLFKYSTNVQ